MALAIIITIFVTVAFALLCAAVITSGSCIVDELVRIADALEKLNKKENDNGTD